VSATEALRELAQEGVEEFGPDTAEAPVLVASAAVFEWIDEDGSRSLTWTSTNPNGDRLPAWAVRGLLHEVLAALDRNATVEQLHAYLEDDDGEDE
jgi:hypothetical protein